MKKGILLVLFGLGLASCNSLKGTLNLYDNLKLNFGYNGKIELAPKTYELEIKLSQDNHYIDVKFMNLKGDEDPTARFNFREEMQIPKQNGTFEILSIDSGQPVDLMGKVSTLIERSELRQDMETCQESTRRTECFADGRGSVRCEDRWEMRNGNKDVEFYQVKEEKTTSVDLISAGKTYGDITIHENKVWRDYTYQGFCRVF